MGDQKTLAEAKKELEELYLGVPDESVNLTFQDLAQVRLDHNKKSSPKPLQPISESTPAHSLCKTTSSPSPLAKLPSLDFNRALESSTRTHGHENHDSHRSGENKDLYGRYGHQKNQDQHVKMYSDTGFRHGNGKSMVYDDMSMGYPERSMGRRRPGIPHSTICTVCSTYIYIFHHRCLVCGRVYCRQCVKIGMGEMTEGRKCIECLGRRFSQRYIQEAGNVGCCMGYPSMVKQQELKWAERGPRRSGEGRHGRSTATLSTTRSPIAPRSPNRAQKEHSPTNSHSFVMSSPYSTYSPTNLHALPF